MEVSKAKQVVSALIIDTGFDAVETTDQLFQCAAAFREAAHQLMQQMATTFSIDLQTLDGLYELKFKKSQKQRRALNAEWNDPGEGFVHLP